MVIVDDGSGESYRSIFDEAKRFINGHGTVISYEDNRGKGFALKTGFKYVLENLPNAIGVVTADSDGQHNPASIDRVYKALLSEPESLILGIREFDKNSVPWKSYWGNTITAKVMNLITGIYISDTQSGLRGIPRAFMTELLTLKENRYDFEMKMLIETYGKYPIREISVETIYDSKDNHKTHFNPFIDSIKIYATIGKKFFKFIISSLSSCVLDLSLFSLFIKLLPEATFCVALSTILARVISASYNYVINYLIVFNSTKKKALSAVKYLSLAITIMLLSAALTTFGATFFTFVPKLLIKVVVDFILFLLSFYIQRKYVF